MFLREKLEHEKLRLEMEEWQMEKQREMERERLEHDGLKPEAENTLKLKKKNTL